MQGNPEEITPEAARSQLAAALRRAMASKGWAPAKLAEESSLKPSTISDALSERHTPSTGTLQAILEALFPETNGGTKPRRKHDPQVIRCIEFNQLRDQAARRRQPGKIIHTPNSESQAGTLTTRRPDKRVRPFRETRMEAQWTFNVGRIPEIARTLAATERTLFVSNQEGLWALNVRTGAEEWRGNFSGHGYVSSSPALIDESVFVGSQHHLYALRADSGEVIWKAPTRNVPEVVAAGPNGMVLAARDKYLMAFDAATGKELWGGGRRFTSGIYRPPAVHKDSTYVNVARVGVYALNAEDGSTKWAYETDLPGLSQIVATDDLVFATSQHLHALNAETGEEEWTIEGAWSPSIENDILYLGGSEQVVALDVKDGYKEKWVSRSPGGTPRIFGGVVYLAFRDELWAIDAATGEGIWRFKLSDYIWWAPLVACGFVYAGDHDGIIYAVPA
ncbi:outer membrane protein assembly factor BamB family protein [Streptomyces umbrinus]|nr:PQQ-binding-like beta-propeller repeat protein [Streptomyces umbrinus]